MSTKLIDVGDVKVSEIMLYNFNMTKELNIYPQVKGIDIFESVDSYSVVGELYIADGIDLINNFPIGGEEIITVTLETPERTEITYEFMVESIAGMSINAMGNTKSYKLRCVTRDFLKNAATIFTRRYTGLKYHEALAECIMTDLESEVQLASLEDTKGKFDYVVNGVRPFQVIDLIKERAVSNEGNKSSTFVFYQDRDGYHFETIERLIKDRKEEASEKTFYYDTSNRAADSHKVINARNILTYDVLTQGSSIDKVKNGAMRTQYREFNFTRGTYYILNEYNNSTDHAVFEATDDAYDFNSADFNEFTSATPAVTKMLVRDGMRPEMEHNRNLHYQRAFIQRLKQYVVRIKVYGDTGIRVGDVVNLQIPETVGTTAEPKISERFAENYIVLNLKHHLQKKKDGEFEHFLIMDCAKPNQHGRPLG